MNSSERDVESLVVPDLYEIEINEQNQKLLDFSVYNETTHNDTVGASGKHKHLTSHTIVPERLFVHSYIVQKYTSQGIS